MITYKETDIICVRNEKILYKNKDKRWAYLWENGFDKIKKSK